MLFNFNSNSLLFVVTFICILNINVSSSPSESATKYYPLSHYLCKEYELEDSYYYSPTKTHVKVNDLRDENVIGFNIPPSRPESCNTTSSTNINMHMHQNVHRIWSCHTVSQLILFYLNFEDIINFKRANKNFNEIFLDHIRFRCNLPTITKIIRPTSRGGQLISYFRTFFDPKSDPIGAMKQIIPSEIDFSIPLWEVYGVAQTILSLTTFREIHDKQEKQTQIRTLLRSKAFKNNVFDPAHSYFLKVHFDKNIVVIKRTKLSNWTELCERDSKTKIRLADLNWSHLLEIFLYNSQKDLANNLRSCEKICQKKSTYDYYPIIQPKIEFILTNLIKLIILIVFLTSQGIIVFKR